MLGRIVEIEQANRHLSLYRGFMVVSQTGENRGEIGRVPLDDIAVVIGNGFGLSYSNNLVVEFAERNIVFVACGANHMPKSYLMPIVGNFEQARRFDAQMEATLPMKKRAWAQVVSSKLQQQALTLEAFGIDAKRLWVLATQVTSGDARNAEGAGAAHYFPALFGRDFRRDYEEPGINAMLNYGYAVMRATVARAIVSAGLHPALGINHSHDNNPMRLADDFIEPFRPLVDRTVMRWLESGEDLELTPNLKRKLVDSLYQDTYSEQGVTPAISAIQKLVTSWAQVILKQRQSLVLPLIKPVRRAIDAS